MHTVHAGIEIGKGYVLCNVLSTKQPLTCLEYVTALCVNHNYIHSHEHMLTDENESTTYTPLESLYSITIYK